MHKSIKTLLVTILIASAIKSTVLADVYGGGYWEAIGLGNMT